MIPEKEESELNKLQKELESWQESLTIRKAKRTALNTELKNQEKKLRLIRSFICQSQKEINQAKKKIKYLYSKKVNLPSRVRKWNLNHMDKVLESFEK